MTVENTQNKMPPLQMGTATEYPFTFAVLLQDPTEEEALEAIKASVLLADGTEIELEYGTDYTVTLNTDRIGGTLTVNNVRTSSDYLTIYRQYEQTQEVDYKDFNSAPAETFEQCFDKLTMLSQQQQEEINRSLKLNVSSTIVNPSLPEPIANNTLIWDSVGSSLKNYDIIGENNQFKAEVNSALATGQAEIQAQFDAFENMIDTEIEDVREAATKINELEQAVEDAQTSASNAQTSAESATQAATSATQAAEQTQADIQEIEEKIEEVGGMLSLEIGDIGFTQMAIDESKGKRRKLNGQIIVQDQFQQLTNILKTSIAQNPDMACTEQEWQAELTMSTAGICYKFVVDNDAGTIRLPKYPNYFIGGVNSIAPVVGNGMTLGLTDGTDNYGLADRNLTGYLTSYGTPAGSSNRTTILPEAKTIGITADPTKSGIEAQVSQEQIKGTYFIQVATGSETEDNIVNTLELNNPFVLLEPKFFEAEVYNISWLLANGTYNGSNAVHPSAYQALLVENNSEVAIGSTVTLPIGTEYTKRGLSVKLSTDSNITDYDFIVNTTDETFRLPIKTNLASGKAVAGNGMALGLTDGSQNFGLRNYALNSTYITVTDGYGVSVGSTTNANAVNVNKAVGVTTDPAKSGIETSDSSLYLYFYVGETVQNANLVNVGRIEEKLSSFLTRNEKQEIISWGMPDYSAGVSISTATEYTGYEGLVAWTTTNSSANYINFKINGKTIVSSAAGNYGAGNSTACLPVCKTDIFTINGAGLTITFYPLKGAN